MLCNSGYIIIIVGLSLVLYIFINTTQKDMLFCPSFMVSEQNPNLEILIYSRHPPQGSPSSIGVFFSEFYYLSLLLVVWGRLDLSSATRSLAG